MSDMNKIILVGRLGKAPEARTTANGKMVVKFSLATAQGYGEKKKTEWHNIVAFGGLAENCAKYLDKGKQCLIEGRVAYRKYDKDGQTRYITEVMADEVRFLGSKSGSDAVAEAA